MTVRKRGHWHFDNLSTDNLFGSAAGYQQNSLGNHYYVDDQNGSDSNSGLSPNKALLTMQAAIDKCTDWHGDVIHVNRGTQTVTTSVLFNKKGIVVVADMLGNPFAMGEYHCIYGSHTDGPAATILQPCVLVGLGFCGSQAAGPSLLIDCNESGGSAGGWSLIKHCRFDHWGIAKAYAIQCKGGADNQIEDCEFDGLWTGYTTAAIYFEDDGAQGCWNYGIERNRFYNIGSGKYCIEVKSGSHLRQVLIKGNNNIGPASPAKFFNHQAQAGDGQICDNYTGNATDTGSFDETVATLQGDGYSISNNHYEE